MAAPAPITHPTPDLWTSLQLLVVDGGVRLLLGIVILVVGWTLAGWAKRGLVAGLARVPIDLTLKPLIASLARYLILIITLLLVVEQFGVQTTSLIAVLGAAGLAIGLALQGTLANVASGVMLLILRPYRVGQDVEIAGKQGIVREIGLFTNLLITSDGVYISIPNSAIFSTTIINYSHERLRRITFPVPVDRANDLPAAQKVIADTVAKLKGVMAEPAPTIVLSQIQEYAVVFTVRCHARSADYWSLLWLAQMAVATALNEARIALPVTRQASVVRNEPQSALTAPPGG